MTTLAFIDTETTGLDADLHEVWEVALVLRHVEGGEERFVWQLPVELGRADPMALRIGQFHERRLEVTVDLPTFAKRFAKLTAEAHLVGAVVSFDEERLRRILRRNGECPMWHYHLVDVETLVAGKLGLIPPWKSTDLSVAIGVDPEQFDRHTALGDALWAQAMYDAVFVPVVSEP